MDEIKESMSKMQQLFMHRMEEFQSELQKTSTPATISTLAADFGSFKSFVITALHTLQEQVQLIARTQDNMEMHSRRKMLLLHGVPEAKMEDLPGVVVNTVVNKVKVKEFSTNAISRCHRMGRAADLNRPRPIVVKIRDFSLRTKIWNSKASLKGSGLTLSEFLTKPRHEVFLAARERFGVEKSWTKDGSVFVLGSDGVRHRVTCVSDLNNFATNVVTKQVVSVPAAIDVPASRSRRGATTSKK